MISRSPRSENSSLGQAGSSPNSPSLTRQEMKRYLLEIQGPSQTPGAPRGLTGSLPAGSLERTARPRRGGAAAGVSSLVRSALQRQQRALRPGKKRGASGRKRTGSGGSGMSWEQVECTDPGPHRKRRSLRRQRSGQRVQSRAPLARAGLAEGKASRHSSAR